MNPPSHRKSSLQKPPASTAEVFSEANQNDGLEILLNMAKTGQIDPWNIDIVKIADEYLRAVADLKDEADESGQSIGLKITGKMILYLAILLRMKSDQLAGIDYLEPPEDSFQDHEMEEDIELADGNRQKLLPYNSIDEFLERRTSIKARRIRKVTLKDLIVELKRYEELEAKRTLRQKLEKNEERHEMRDYSHLTSDDIEGLAHEEFIEDTILRLMGVLERLLVYHEEISLSQLMDEGEIDKVSAFLALLFLSARGQVNMHQEEFYSELYVSYDDDNDLIPEEDNSPVEEPMEKVS